MATTKPSPERPPVDSRTGGEVVNQLPTRDHDRVTMLSVRADGTADQTPDVEMIGDRQFAQEATRRQFAEQAVSAADVAARGVTAGGGVLAGDEDPLTGEVGQDPKVSELQQQHEQVAEQARAQADTAVEKLFTKDEQLQTDTGSGPRAGAASADRPDFGGPKADSKDS